MRSIAAGLIAALVLFAIWRLVSFIHSEVGWGEAAHVFKLGFYTLARVLLLIAVAFALLRACSSDDCQRYKDSFGENSAEYQQCRSQARGKDLTCGAKLHPGKPFGHASRRHGRKRGAHSECVHLLDP